MRLVIRIELVLQRADELVVIIGLIGVESALLGNASSVHIRLKDVNRTGYPWVLRRLLAIARLPAHHGSLLRLVQPNLWVGWVEVEERDGVIMTHAEDGGQRTLVHVLVACSVVRVDPARDS